MADQNAPAGQQDVKSAADDLFDLGTAMLDADETSTEESSTEEKNESTEAKPAETEGKPKDPGTTEDDESEEAEEADDDSAESEESTDETKDGDEQPKKKDAATRKAELNNEIRTMVATKKQLETDIAQLTAEKYRTQSEEELVAEGMDPAEAKAEADRQERAMTDYSRDVADLNNALEIETKQLWSDFPMFDPQSTEFNQKLADRAKAAYVKAANPQRDENTGLVNKVNVLPYDFYAAFAETHLDAAASAEAQGRVAGQKAAEKMAAAAEPSSSTGTATEDDESDPFLKGFNSVK